MACNVKKKDRTEYVQNIVLDAIAAIVGPDVPITLETSLGKWGLGHTPTKRKFYYEEIKIRLEPNGCAMGKLKPADFADAKLKTIGDIATAVEKDLV